MIELKIDNISLKVPDGTNLLDAARSEGIEIPSLCYDSKVPHYSSCMVCMVKNLESGKYIPACSVKAESGMEIDASGKDVAELRREALKLLLVEHRAECEAPCFNVCPAGYDIAEINRNLADENYKEAYELIKEKSDNTLACIECKAPCEKACRRKMIDRSISIRSMMIYLHKKSGGNESPWELKEKEKNSRFNSTIGRIDDHEKTEWLKEAYSRSERHSNIEDDIDLKEEASACMHCDCRAKDNCKLRELCNDLDIKNPTRIRSGNSISKKINSSIGLVFENAKCIKCGLCVRIMAGQTKNDPLCFTGRGFMSIITEPLTSDFEDIRLEEIRDAVEICPTGALAIDERMKKSGK